MSAGAVFILHIDIQSRPGYFCAKSADLPGLHVCGETEDQLRRCPASTLMDIEAEVLSLRPLPP